MHIPIHDRRVIVGSILFLFVLDEKTFTRSRAQCTFSNSDNRNLEGIQTGEKINPKINFLTV